MDRRELLGVLARPPPGGRRHGGGAGAKSATAPRSTPSGVTIRRCSTSARRPAPSACTSARTDSITACTRSGPGRPSTRGRRTCASTARRSVARRPSCGPRESADGPYLRGLRRGLRRLPGRLRETQRPRDETGRRSRSARPPGPAGRWSRLWVAMSTISPPANAV